MPSDQKLGKLLSEAKSIAIVGAKDSPGQPVDSVGRYLIEAGYTVIPIHPARDVVWGLPAYKSLDDVMEPVDIVDVFRRPEFCPGHAEEALELSPVPALFWMQLGIASEEASAIMRRAGAVVVENRCLMVEHRRLRMQGLIAERN